MKDPMTQLLQKPLMASTSTIIFIISHLGMKPMLVSQRCAVTYGSDAASDATASAKAISGVCFSSGAQESALGRNQRIEEGGCVDEL